MLSGNKDEDQKLAARPFDNLTTDPLPTDDPLVRRLVACKHVRTLAVESITRAETLICTVDKEIAELERILRARIT